MGLNDTLAGERLQIAILGRRNAGKSSVLNILTGQNLAIVSDQKGTTTDPVYKAMEILPLGACMLIDTPGLDDEGTLGRMRVEKAMQVLNRTELALLVVDISQISQEELESKRGLGGKETELLQLLEEKKIPCCVVLNQADRIEDERAEEIRSRLVLKNGSTPVNVLSTVTGDGLEELKDTLVSMVPGKDPDLHIVGDLVQAGDMVVLVMPIDEAAPKGRIIMPQQQVIRDLLDHNAVAVATQVPSLPEVLKRLDGQVRMVITDSQAFGEVARIVPEDIMLTSFSILFARRKGDLDRLTEGVARVEELRDGDRVLIAEGCTHRRQCNDIGTVKIPRWLRERTGKELVIDTCSGMEFPADLSPYRLIIHCGGCTLHEKEMKHRMYRAGQQNVPMVNYGILIAYLKGILQRSRL